MEEAWNILRPVLPDMLGAIMSRILNSLGQLMSQALFSLITPPLLMPRIARLPVTRRIIAFCFGRLYVDKYDNIIAAFRDKYAEPMSVAIKKAKESLNHEARIILDCGTGTGFVTRLAAAEFPHASVIATDILRNMLGLARNSCRTIKGRVLHVQADTFSLPLADESVDMILVQNTMPAFHEYHRICRPGGMVLYVDTSAGWIAGLARRLVDRHCLFDRVEGERVGIGFFVLAQKTYSQDDSNVTAFTGGDIRTLLKCPLDKAALTFDGKLIKCERGHTYPVIDGFPSLIPNEARL
jgi:SAM-dependent methyltransferase